MPRIQEDASISPESPEEQKEGNETGQNFSKVTTRTKNRSSNKKKIQELMSSCVRRPTDKRKRLADEENLDNNNYDSVAYMRHL